MSKLIVGVTGGIGAGKSAATSHFEQLGITIVDADIVAREIVAPDSPTLAKLVDIFGEDILLEDGALNRAKLRELVFSDDTAKASLNGIMHPAIRTEIMSQLGQANSPYVILSAPLLIENGLEKNVNSVVVVDVPETLQLARASARDDVSEEQIKAIMQSQCSRKDRLKHAEYVLDNSGTLKQLHEQVERLHDELMQRTKR